MKIISTNYEADVVKQEVDYYVGPHVIAFSDDHTKLKGDALSTVLHMDKNHLDYLEPNAEYAEHTLDNKFQIFVKRSEYTAEELTFLMDAIETMWEEAGCLLKGIN